MKITLHKSVFIYSIRMYAADIQLKCALHGTGACIMCVHVNYAMYSMQLSLHVNLKMQILQNAQSMYEV